MMQFRNPKKIKSLAMLAGVATISLTLAGSASATTFTFNTDPFAGSTAPTTPGRQVVGGEPSISFSLATDVFAYDPAVFGVSGQVNFATGIASSLPTSGANAIVLQSLDNDANPATPFGAGNAADLIAGRVTSPGAGFFVYFNSALDLPRLVFSTNLDDNTADLKILARLTNLSGQAGRDALPTFSASNFASTPEPSTYTMFGLSGGLFAAYMWRKRNAKPTA